MKDRYICIHKGMVVVTDGDHLSEEALLADDDATFHGNSAVMAENGTCPHVEVSRTLEGEPVVEHAPITKPHIGPPANGEMGTGTYIAEATETDPMVTDAGEGETQTTTKVATEPGETTELPWPGASH